MLCFMHCRTCCFHCHTCIAAPSLRREGRPLPCVVTVVRQQQPLLPPLPWVWTGPHPPRPPAPPPRRWWLNASYTNCLHDLCVSIGRPPWDPCCCHRRAIVIRVPSWRGLSAMLRGTGSAQRWSIGWPGTILMKPIMHCCCLHHRHPLPTWSLWSCRSGPSSTPFSPDPNPHSSSCHRIASHPPFWLLSAPTTGPSQYLIFFDFFIPPILHHLILLHWSCHPKRKAKK